MQLAGRPLENELDDAGDRLERAEADDDDRAALDAQRDVARKDIELLLELYG